MSAKSLCSVGIVLMAALFARDAYAVAFKVRNNTGHTLRVRIQDRGTWRAWVTCGPNFWGDIATDVKREKHPVQVDYWNGSKWTSMHRGVHGSLLWTRILQVIDAPGGGVVIAWWDEPGGGCRDAPDTSNTCLKRSGDWMIKDLEGVIVKVGQAYMLGQ